MGPFELETRITIVVESVGGPVLRGAVTSLAILLLVQLELAPVHIRMTRIAGDRRASVHTSLM